ncbi:unnamed protein product [Oppiella nova]|uniref:Uncharacterized protein n=1 Tax=Oppiella nova TaxID=334625 RepID=A0A7R9MFL0_9ACAR|nr:unnamed protein product [Oppiella nova]CAG2176483.1 unnamed protein product [Oppiella nova]
MNWKMKDNLLDHKQRQTLIQSQLIQCRNHLI